MKKILVLIVAILFSFGMKAQKYAMIDMEYITNNIPTYVKANELIKKESDKQQKIIDIRVNEIKELYKEYANLQATASKSTLEAKENVIINKEKEVAELRKKYFSPEGEINKMREKLLNPIQENIYEVVKAIALANGYAMVIDRASTTGVIFADPKIDISNQVLRKLGYQ